MRIQNEQAEELVDAFDSFDGWEDRYRFLIDLGRKLPPLPEDARTEEHRVHGCQSQVWIIAAPTEQNNQEVVDFVADSDSTLVRGLIAVLRRVYAGQPAQAVLNFDIEGLLERLGLNQHLSLSRRNGLYGMVQRIKALASQMQSAA
jgi:sulfur transfer protein SufE